MPEPREQTIEKVAWAVHRACGCDGCPPHQEDWQGSRDAFNQVITPLLAAARREGAEQALREAARHANGAHIRPRWGDDYAAWLDARADNIAKGEDE